MTEELEKEAEEYIKANNLEWELECYRTSPIGEVKQAYLAGAEPREKQIAELEAQLEHEKNLSQCRLDHNEQLRKMTMEAKEIIREYIRLSLQEDKDIDANVKLFQKAETFIKE